MKHKPLPDVDVLRAYLRYVKRTGKFYWRISPTNKIVCGGEAGTQMKNGYVHIQLGSVLYLAHRLAWRWVTGEDPGPSQVDHRNRKRSDNRWSNIRLAHGKEGDNLQNLSRRRDCASGYTGVHWDVRKLKWRAYIGVGGKNMHLGYFDTKKKAVAARKQAKTQFHTFSPKDAK